MLKKLIPHLLSSIPLLLVIILQLPLITPFLHPNFFAAHDAVQTQRIFEIHQSIKYGDFPPRWGSGLFFGYGYPLFIFYSPLTYLVGAFFVFLGFNYLVATKIVFLLTFFLGAVGIYLLLKYLMGPLPALAGSIIFSLVPYRAVNIYVRGNLAEFFAQSLFPLLLFVNLKLLDAKKSLLWIIAFSITLAALPLSHNISSFIYISFLVPFNIFLLFRLEKSLRISKLFDLIKSTLLSLGLSSFYWIPLLYESKFVKIDYLQDWPFAQFFLTPTMIWSSPWGYGGFTEPNPMSLQLGQVMIVLSLISFLLNLFIKSKLRSILFFVSITALIAFFLETRSSYFFWDKIPLLRYMQFPWRYHILLTFCGAILSASLIYLLQLKFKLPRLAYSVLIIAILGLSLKESFNFFKPKSYTDFPLISVSTTWNDEYLPQEVKNIPTNYPPDKARIVSGKGILTILEWGYLTKKFLVDLSEPSTIRIEHFYYPGWIAKINNQEIPIQNNNDRGVMTVNVPAGRFYLDFDFTRTWWRTTADSITLFSFALLVFFLTKPLIRLKK